MCPIFISHSSNDNDVVRGLVEELKRSVPDEDVFVDFDVEGIQVGEKWEQRLYSELRKSSAVVLAWSENADRSPWCFAEVALARSAGKTVLRLALPKAPPVHPLLQDTQYAVTTTAEFEEEEGFQRLVEALKQGGGFTVRDGRPVYPGLQPFQPDDAALFFGRQDEIQKLVECVSARGLASRLVVLVGPSGCGKSSLMRAGLIPRLRRMGEWYVLPVIVPGGKPVSALAMMLADELTRLGRPATDESVKDRLRAPDGLVGIAREIVAAHAASVPTPRSGTARVQSVLLALDQFEEIVTRAGTEEESELIRIVADALDDPNNLVRVLVTLRSDFFTAALKRPELGDDRLHTVLVSPLRRERLADVILKPAERVNLSFDPAVAQEMIEDTRTGDALPLLAFTLAEIYESVTGDNRWEVTVADYRASGGVQGALRKRANRVKEAVEKENPGISITSVLLRLVSVDAENEPTRRRASGPFSADEEKVLKAFVDARLLVPTPDSAGNVVYDLAHEALLSAWPPLEDAIRAGRDRLRLRTDVERAARDWEADGKSTNYLLRGRRLTDASVWMNDARDEVGQMPQIVEFITASMREDVDTSTRYVNTAAELVSYRLNFEPDAAVAASLELVQERRTHAAQTALHSALIAAHCRRRLVHADASPVTGLIFSSGRNELVTASEDGVARAWDLDTCTVLAEFPHPGPVLSIGGVPAGRRFATVMEDGSARIWTHGKVEPDRLIHSASYRILCSAITPDGELLSAGCDDGALRLFSTTRQERGRKSAESMSDPIAAIAISPDGRLIATGDANGTLALWTRESLKQRYQKTEHADRIACVRFSPNGKFLITASRDGTACVWDVKTGKKLRDLEHRSGLTWAEFSPDHRWVATATNDGTARLWQTKSPRVDQELVGHEHSITAVAFSPDGRFASSSRDGSVRVWDPTNEWIVRTLGEHDKGAVSAEFAPDGTSVVTASADGCVYIYEAASSRRILKFKQKEPVWYAAYSRSGREIATADDDGTIRILSVPSGELLSEHHDHAYAALSVAFSTDGTRVVSAARDGSAVVWSFVEQRRLQLLMHDAGLTSAAFSHDGALVVTTSEDQKATIWDAETGDRIRVLSRHRDVVSGAEFSKDDKIVATACSDRTVRLFDVDSGTLVQELKGHRAGVYSVAFSPDGAQLASAGQDGTAVIWDVAAGARIKVFEGHKDEVQSVAFSPDGRSIVTASWDGTVRVWKHFTLDELIDEARTRPVHKLTLSERSDFGMRP